VRKVCGSAYPLRGVRLGRCFFHRLRRLEDRGAPVSPAGSVGRWATSHRDVAAPTPRSF